LGKYWKGTGDGGNEPPSVYKIQVAYCPAPDQRLATKDGNLNGAA